MQFHGQYQLADVKAAHRLHSQQSRLTTWAGYVVIGFVAFMTLLGIPFAVQGRLPWTLLLLPAIAFGAWAFFRFYLLPCQLEQAFKQQKDLSAPFTVDLTDTGFEFRNEFGNSRIPWGDFVKWKENHEMLLLYRSDYRFHMLPKRIFEAQGGIAYVREKLQQHNVRSAGQVRNRVQTVLVVALVLVVIVVFLFQFLASSGIYAG